MKGAAYRYAAVESRHIGPNQLKLLFLDRKKKRGFRDPNKLKRAISSRFPVVDRSRNEYVGSRDANFYDGRSEREGPDFDVLFGGSGVVSPWFGIGESAVYSAAFDAN